MCDHHRQPQHQSTARCVSVPQPSGCCTSRSNNTNTGTTTQRDSCHTHTHSREITRSNSAPAACHSCEESLCSTHHQIFRSTSRIEVLLRELLDRCIEDEYSVCTESCVTTRCSGWERCGVCESDRQVVVSELMELLERVSTPSSRSCDGRGMVRWSERERSGHGFCGQEVRYEAQTLFEILLRITRRKSHTSSHGRCGGRRRGERHSCVGERYEEVDVSLRRLVAQLLDELEGNAGCECQSCSEYLEINLRRMRRELRRGGECSSREVVCAGSHGGCIETASGGCTGCCDTVSKTVVYGTAPRRPRTGNVHVGWSLR